MGNQIGLEVRIDVVDTKQGLKNVTERNGINGIFSDAERNETEKI
jgi:hypothetical protein